MLQRMLVAGLLQCWMATPAAAHLQMDPAAGPQLLQLLRCVSALCRAHMPPSLPVLLWADPRSRHLVDGVAARLHGDLRWPVALSARAPGVGGQVLLLRGARDLQGFPGRPSGRVLAATPSCDPAAAHHTLSRLRARGVVGALLLGLCPGSVDVYSWSPRHPVLRDRWLFSAERFLRGPAAPPPAGPAGFHGRRLRVSCFPNGPYTVGPYLTPGRELRFEDGVEIRMLEEVSRRRNFTISYVPIPPHNYRWGGRLPNGTWTGVVGNIVYDKADVGLSGMMTSYERLSHLDLVYPYMKERVSWIVPLAKPLPRWKSLIKIFSPLLWLAVIGTGVFSYTFFWLAALLKLYVQSDSPEYLPYWRFALNFYSVLLGNPSPRIPLSPSLRVFMVGLMGHCLLVNTAYRTFLVTSMTHPGLERQIGSVEEVVAAGLGLGFHPNARRFFADGSSLSRTILQGHTPCPDVESCIARVARVGDFAVAQTRSSAEFLVSRSFTDDDDEPLVKFLPRDVVSYDVTAYLKKGSRLAEVFDEIVSRLRESGLVDQWTGEVKRNAVARRRASSDDSPTVLTVAHVQGAFTFLGLGLLVGGLVFVGELRQPSKSL